jgi:hypothetical protein
MSDLVRKARRELLLFLVLTFAVSGRGCPHRADAPMSMRLRRALP